MDPAVRQFVTTAVERGDRQRAAVACDAYLQARASLDAHHVLAAALSAHGDARLALKYFIVLRDALPDRADVADGYGLALRRAGRLDDAVAQWRLALALAPNDAGICRNLAMGLLDLGRDEDAAEILTGLLTLMPQDRDALLHLGNVRYRRNDFHSACRFYWAALEADARFVDAWIGLGETLRALDRGNEAEACFRAAIEIAPDARLAHFNLACLLLAQGRWSEGFREYQWRVNLAKVPRALAALPRWSDTWPTGARVALWNDQGFGDAILFMRYVARLQARGYRVTLVLPDALTRLARTLAGIEAVCCIGDPLPPLDCQASLPSLPQLLGEPDLAAAWAGPYLAAEDSPVPLSDAFSVGIVWAANSDSPNGRDRSIPLSKLAPLSAVRGIDWVSLQVGAPAGELACSPWVGMARDLSPCLSSFADTAAVVGRLDLVITVDTSVAHLAGAMGRPVWVMLAQRCDWRWSASNARCYPSARLFRRCDGDDWTDLAQTVAMSLREWRALPAR